MDVRAILTIHFISLLGCHPHDVPLDEGPHNGEYHGDVEMPEGKVILLLINL